MKVVKLKDHPPVLSNVDLLEASKKSKKSKKKSAKEETVDVPESKKKNLSKKDEIRKIQLKSSYDDDNSETEAVVLPLPEVAKSVSQVLLPPSDIFYDSDDDEQEFRVVSKEKELKHVSESSKSRSAPLKKSVPITPSKKDSISKPSSKDTDAFYDRKKIDVHTKVPTKTLITSVAAKHSELSTAVKKVPSQPHSAVANAVATKPVSEPKAATANVQQSAKLVDLVSNLSAPATASVLNDSVSRSAENSISSQSNVSLSSTSHRSSLPVNLPHQVYLQQNQALQQQAMYQYSLQQQQLQQQQLQQDYLKQQLLQTQLALAALSKQSVGTSLPVPNILNPSSIQSRAPLNTSDTSLFSGSNPNTTFPALNNSIFFGASTSLFSDSTFVGNTSSVAGVPLTGFSQDSLHASSLGSFFSASRSSGSDVLFSNVGVVGQNGLISNESLFSGTSANRAQLNDISFPMRSASLFSHAPMQRYGYSHPDFDAEPDEDFGAEIAVFMNKEAPGYVN